jgi:uncharacterized protein (UPF0276 family)
MPTTCCPLPLTEEALAHVAARIGPGAGRLRRTILIENVSSYFEYADSAMPEWEFLAEVARRSGCGILLDVNNIHVSAHNHGFDAATYLRRIPRDAVPRAAPRGARRKVRARRGAADRHAQPAGVRTRSGTCTTRRCSASARCRR